MNSKPAILLAALAMTLTACQNYRSPRMSATPASMSSDTLCYRHATTKSQPLADEITRRNLDCRDILENDPLLAGRRY